MHIEPEEKVLDVVCGMELDPSHTSINLIQTLCTITIEKMTIG